LPTTDAGSVLNGGVQLMVCTIHFSEKEADAAYIRNRCSEFIDGSRFEVSGVLGFHAVCKVNRRRRFGTSASVNPAHSVTSPNTAN